MKKSLLTLLLLTSITNATVDDNKFIKVEKCLVYFNNINGLGQVSILNLKKIYGIYVDNREVRFSTGNGKNSQFYDHLYTNIENLDKISKEFIRCNEEN